MAELTVKIAQMRTRITLQAPTVSTGAGAAKRTTYTTITDTPTIWAQWINDHGQEETNAQARTYVQRATVRIRHRTDINDTWQVLKDGQAWRVLSVDPVQDENRWIELRVEKVQATS